MRIVNWYLDQVIPSVQKTWTWTRSTSTERGRVPNMRHSHHRRMSLWLRPASDRSTTAAHSFSRQPNVYMHTQYSPFLYRWPFFATPITTSGRTMDPCDHSFRAKDGQMLYYMLLGFLEDRGHGSGARRYVVSFRLTCREMWLWGSNAWSKRIELDRLLSLKWKRVQREGMNMKARGRDHYAWFMMQDEVMLRQGTKSKWNKRKASEPRCRANESQRHNA